MIVMKLKEEIRKIAEYQNSQLPKPEKRSEIALDAIVEKALAAQKNNTLDFSKLIHIRIKQADKLRKIKLYEPFSPEALFCVYLKRILDRKYHPKYPNRNEFMHSLFDVTNALKDMGDYTIFRFDFEDFFNSVSSIYVYYKYLSSCPVERWELDLLKDFAEKTQYAFAGLNTSNILCEIAAKEFDTLLLQKITQRGAIYYRRYIDDGIIIFNQHIEKQECESLICEAINDTFFDINYKTTKQCKTKINASKTKYIAKRDMVTTGNQYCFDFLGYLFVLENEPRKNKTIFHYGLTESKRVKYQDRINRIVKEYAESSPRNLELLRHQIKAFSSRTVYQVTRYKTVIWKSKGLISNYCELSPRINQLTYETEYFLKNTVKEAFAHCGLSIPYFLKGDTEKSIYNLYCNLRKNRTLLFVELIGIDRNTLEKMCKQIGVDTTGVITYEKLVREYLIRVKVGH
jgi:hypothetical protein